MSHREFSHIGLSTLNSTRPEKEADTERLVGQGANAMNRVAQQVRRMELPLHHAEPAGTAHRGRELRATEVRTHRCGNDRKLDPERIAEMCSKHDPSSLSCEF